MSLKIRFQQSHFFYFYGIVKWRIFLMLVMSIFVGFLDGVGLTMFIPLIQYAGANGESGQVDVGKLDIFIDWLESHGIELTIISILIVIAVFFVFKGIFRYSEAIYKAIVFQYFMRHLRERNVKLLAGYKYMSFVNADAGKIQNTLSGEMSRIASAFGFYQSALQSVTMVSVYMVLAFAANTQFAILISVGGLLSNLIFRTIYKRTTQISRKITSIGHSYHGLLIQMVNHFKYLVATGAMSNYSEKLLKSVDEMVENNLKIGFYNALLLAIREPIIIIVVLSVILIQVSVLGQTIGSIILALLFFYRALNFVISLQTQWNSFLNNKGALENIQEFQNDLVQNQSKSDGIQFHELQNQIKIDKGHFQYGDNPILVDFNIIFKKNWSYALVGESGSGKTTLVNILSGLLELSRGKFFIDGQDLKDVNLFSYQRKIGYITQEPVIFNDSLFNNITMWALKSEENLKKFNEVLEMAMISEFVSMLESKEDTILGNNGINLSGGQKQRVSIARELFKDVEILIMDEATSALDSETEFHIKQNIDHLKGAYTIIIVAHRLSTIKNVDEVILMDKGKIDAKGTYTELLGKSEKFQRMVSLQELVTN